MPKLQTLALLATLSLSCAHAPKSVPSARIITVAPDAKIVHIEVRSGSQVQKLPRDTELPIGSDFALSVELAGPGYVYLVRSPKTEAAQRLYPAPGSPDAVLDAGPLRVPSADAWLRLDRFGAEDLLCLLLSAQPLPASEQRCEPTRPGSRNDDDPKPPPPREVKSSPPPPPPPPPVDPRGPEAESKIKVIRLMIKSPS